MLTVKTKLFLKKYLKFLSNIYYNKTNLNLQLKFHNYVTFETKNHLLQNSELKYSYSQLFDTVYFEIRTKCNSQCSFCAASIQNETRPDITMDLNLYKKAINELSNLKFDGTIAFHVNSEPLLVKNIDDYISYAREKVPNSWIQILSNGKSLNANNGKKIIEAGINELSLNIYNNNLDAKLPKNIKNFEDEVLNKYFNKNQIYSGHRDKSLKGKFIKYNKYKRLLTEVLSNRGGTAPNKKTNEPLKQKYGFCEFPFLQLNITADGRVGQCCSDLYFDNVMGNIKFESLTEIWSGSKFSDLRNRLLLNDRTNHICDKCDYYGISKPPKNIIRKMMYYMLKHN